MNLKVLVFFSVLCFSKSSRILVFLPMPMHSHFTLASRLVEELLNRDHEIVFVTPFPKENQIENLTQISVNSITKSFQDTRNKLWTLDKETVLKSGEFIANLGVSISEEVLKHQNVQKLLNSNERFHLAILPEYANEAFLGIASHFKVPVVTVAPMPLFSWNSFKLSHPAPSSYVPNLLSAYTGHMNFWQRISNAFYDFYTILYYQLIILPKHKQLVEKYIPGKHDFYKLLNNISLLFINSHISCYDAYPQIPNVVEIGGFHLKPPKKLPQDLQKYLDQSKHGVILFSMGSNLKSVELEDEKRLAILNTFSKLRFDVLWKWEDESMPNKPKNVKLMKWIPQSDVLGHPNIKAFITHGGLFSTMESIYNRVPLVGIPIFSDQKMNMASAVSAGYAQVVSFRNLNEKSLSNALNEILYNQNYKINVMKKSKILKDRPIKPNHLVIYWTEYVLRHQGASHLRYTGMDLYWFQRFLLDVLAFVLIVVLTTAFVLNKIFKFFSKNFSKIELNILICFISTKNKRLL